MLDLFPTTSTPSPPRKAKISGPISQQLGEQPGNPRHPPSRKSTVLAINSGKKPFARALARIRFFAVTLTATSGNGVGSNQDLLTIPSVRSTVCKTSSTHAVTSRARKSVCFFLCKWQVLLIYIKCTESLYFCFSGLQGESTWQDSAAAVYGLEGIRES